jgi:pSer/pThr/pTyr-binding forkhead associated (FHA) protein
MAQIVLFGPGGARSYPVTDTVVTVGRSPANTIHIVDGAASRKHCLVKRETDASYTLVDMGSANGTYVNNERVKEKGLVAEDRIKIGKTILVFKEQ